MEQEVKVFPTDCEVALGVRFQTGEEGEELIEGL